MADNGIGSWDVSTLTKFVRDIFENQPPQMLPVLAVDQLTVNKALRVLDKSDYAVQRVYRYVATVGNPAFTNAWVNFGGSYDGAGFIRTVDNFIRLHGVIKSGAVGSPCFTLPPGYRPSTLVTVPCISNNAIGRIDIGVDGTVTPQLPSSNVWVSLDGIAFKRSIIDTTQ